ncbi:hypothetical protein HA464_03105 [Rhizobium leguminosarum bv. trifolii]|uniref:hypothetical protein n=1 Tax=Rhizobium ruizarguesonis TaxID=2081791 RepID=UPI00102FFDF6|nr:hypothetical protein [Rhizobium ruizarguesonis]QIO43071.1 hypothetical protein HA464_03105 [Rhizobium leguminosarum bv. trifolii]TAZ19532.1 hypothetical protein ELH77_12540 [Rhizobium ruizarguesonis]
MALRTLCDSSVLALIAIAAERVGVEAVLFGGVASRALLFDAAGLSARDLFELAEHVADIEIGHTGPSDLTPSFAKAIASFMPLAPWFRWSIVDRYGLDEIASFQPHGITVPRRRLGLGTKRLFDPREIPTLLKRALVGDIDLLANLRFDASSMEASAALLYIDAVIDIIETYARRPRPRRYPFFSYNSAIEYLAAEGVRYLERMDGSDSRFARSSAPCELLRIWSLPWRRARIFGAGASFRPDPSYGALTCKTGFGPQGERRDLLEQTSSVDS